MKDKTPPQIFNISLDIPEINSLNNTEYKIPWMRAVSTYTLCSKYNKYNNKHLKNLLETLEQFNTQPEKLKNHIKTVFYFFFINILDNIQEYPDYDIFKKASAIAQPWHNYQDELYIQKCHKYIMRQLKNQHFFNLNESPLHNLASHKNKRAKITIPYQPEFLIKISAKHTSFDQKYKPPTNQYFTQIGRNSLFKFSAHIAPPTKPKLLIEGLAPDFNEKLTTNLISKGLADGNGDLVEDNDGNLKICTPKGRELFQKILEEPCFSRKITKEASEIIQKNYLNIMEKRKSLEGFSYTHSLALTIACLTEDTNVGKLPEPLLQEVQRLTDIAYQISCMVNQVYSTPEGDTKTVFCPQDNTFCYNLARDIIEQIIENKKTLILQSGPPVKNDGKFSTHAFYVTLKYLEGNRLEIILVDGGSGSKYFTPVKKNKKDLQQNEFHYAAFKPVSLDDGEMVKVVQNYIFSILILPYTLSDKNTDKETKYDNEEIGPSPRCHERLWENIFLVQKEDGQFFKGYQEKCYKLERSTLNQTFKKQVTGNCTIHNFKKALLIATGMSAIDYGRLEDTLVLGLDQLINKHEMQCKA
ncbi:MAG: hypothetical protein VX835_05455 [Pseudomonadota bacterium]|nr:hypothetical protein [Pseudomonadota bacterium]